MPETDSTALYPPATDSLATPAAGLPAPRTSAPGVTFDRLFPPPEAGRDDIPVDTPATTTVPFHTLQEMTPPAADGFTGTERPYAFRTDDAITVLLMACLFLSAAIITRSRRPLSAAFKSFFRRRPLTPLRSERTASEWRGGLFFLFQVSFCLGILYYDYLQEVGSHSRLPDSPYLIIGLGMVAATLLISFKIGIYHLAGRVFYGADKSEQWSDAYLLVVLIQAVLLLPITLLVAYFDLAYAEQTAAFISIEVLCKALILYRCFRIFCEKTFDSVHIILYFCTIEIIPTLITWRVLTWTITNLTEIL